MLGLLTFECQFGGSDTRPSAFTSDYGSQSGQSEQIIGGGGDFTLQFNFPSSYESRSPESSDHLTPAEDFLDTFANALTARVSYISFSPLGATPGLSAFVISHNRPVSDGNMRHDAEPLDRIEECSIFISGIHPHSSWPQTLMFIYSVEHGCGLDALSDSVGFVNCDIDAQPAAVFHQNVQAVTQDGRFTFAFSQEPGFGIDNAAMRLVAAPLVAEVDRGVAGIAVVASVADFVVLGIDGPQTLHRSERLDETAVDAEVVFAGESFGDSLTDNTIKEMGPLNKNLLS